MDRRSERDEPTVQTQREVDSQLPLHNCKPQYTIYYYYAGFTTFTNYVLLINTPIAITDTTDTYC